MRTQGGQRGLIYSSPPGISEIYGVSQIPILFPFLNSFSIFKSCLQMNFTFLKLKETVNKV